MLSNKACAGDSPWVETCSALAAQPIHWNGTRNTATSFFSLTQHCNPPSMYKVYLFPRMYETPRTKQQYTTSLNERQHDWAESDLHNRQTV